MQSKREQAFVGLFVLIAVAVLFGTVFAMSGAYGRSTTKFHAYFAFAGGLEPGATVRYAGGPKVGRVDSIQLDPQNPARLDIVFTVQSDLPVKVDSSVKIMSMSPLGDNHLEIYPGTAQTPRAASGAALPSLKYVDFNALTAQLNDLNPQAQELLRNLNDRASEVKETIARVNDLLGPQNRANLAATIANARGMLEENRPQIKTTLHNVNAVSEKLQPLLEDFRKTSEQANQTLNHVDAMVGENRADVRQARDRIGDLRARHRRECRKDVGQLGARGCSIEGRPEPVGSGHGSPKHRPGGSDSAGSQEYPPTANAQPRERVGEDGPQRRRPPSRRNTRSARLVAAASCVTSRTALPSSAIDRSSSSTPSPDSASRFPVGSSARMT